MSRSELSVSRWLEAHTDRGAGLTTLPRNAILTDIVGNGDYHLVITDLKLDNDTKSRLKVYKGTLMTHDQALSNTPNSVISFYADLNEPRIPVVGVACGSELFLYKNLKPFYKCKVPSCPLSEQESELWKTLMEKQDFNSEDIIKELKKIPFSLLSSRSQHILNLESPLKIEEYIRKYINSMPTKENVITCMSTIEKTTHDKYSVNCPIIGTEFGNIYILDPQNFSILHQANTCNVKATPFIIECSGLYDIEFRIIVACREGYICILRKGWLEGKSLIQITNDIVDMVLIPGDNFITVATADKGLHCYTKRGQKLWSATTTNSITCLCLVPLDHINMYMVAVGMKNGLIHLYHGRHLTDFTVAPDTPSVIVFGPVGQEENVMVIVTMGGTISFKILKRTADFSNRNHESVPVLQGKPLPLPKRSKLFLEQSLRERQSAVEIHQTFQQDLLRLRLTTARALVQNLSDQSGVGNEKENIKLSAQVLGLGPKFTVILTLENINPNKVLTGLSVTFHSNPIFYTLTTYIITVPLIPPSLSYKMETRVQETMSETSSETSVAELEPAGVKVIRVFVTRYDHPRPILAATINMPPTEFMV
ncbi:Bardet-Biedl syndrome 1 protein homolog [Sitophilus oryzae]|uniref:Bardet-Biedl syndrome 1 protein homolog n=1 Tax=Sitophilus oryzae TaxID=7048 RepID=A0A6J2YDE6_SITOR|nr:Bardet-Biedl syndrome 1 protein homolog [Sitophilus oryzae]